MHSFYETRCIRSCQLTALLLLLEYYSSFATFICYMLHLLHSLHFHLMFFSVIFYVCRPNDGRKTNEPTRNEITYADIVPMESIDANDETSINPAQPVIYSQLASPSNNRDPAAIYQTVS